MKTLSHASQQDFRDAMSRLGAAVNIVTTEGPSGQHGLVASAVCSVSDTPPTLIVCVNRGARANAILKDNGVLCVNILASEHRAISATFADSTVPIADRFAQSGAWASLASGAPAFEDALAAVDCKIIRTEEVGSHTVFICEVLSIKLGAARAGLVYFDRAYHHTAALSEAGL
jgi:flavin reductase